LVITISAWLAWISLSDKTPYFYPQTPSDVRAEENKLRVWINKRGNYVHAVNRWNALNPKYAIEIQKEEK
jgi:hypothetical protein